MTNRDRLAAATKGMRQELIERRAMFGATANGVPTDPPKRTRKHRRKPTLSLWNKAVAMRAKRRRNVLELQLS